MNEASGMRLPYDGETRPDELIIDPETGLAINVPLAWQGTDIWPHTYERILRLRKELGIEVEEPTLPTTPRTPVRSSGRRPVRHHPQRSADQDQTSDGPTAAPPGSPDV